MTSLQSWVILWMFTGQQCWWFFVQISSHLLVGRFISRRFSSVWSLLLRIVAVVLKTLCSLWALLIALTVDTARCILLRLRTCHLVTLVLVDCLVLLLVTLGLFEVLVGLLCSLLLCLLLLLRGDLGRLWYWLSTTFRLLLRALRGGCVAVFGYELCGRAGSLSR